MYQIPCKDCPTIYTDETGKNCGADRKHRKEKKYTGSRKKDSVSEVHSSALTDHVTQTDHTIDWGKVLLLMPLCPCVASKRPLRLDRLELIL